MAALETWCLGKDNLLAGTKKEQSGVGTGCLGRWWSPCPWGRQTHRQTDTQTDTDGLTGAPHAPRPATATARPGRAAAAPPAPPSRRARPPSGRRGSGGPRSARGPPPAPPRCGERAGGAREGVRGVPPPRSSPFRARLAPYLRLRAPPGSMGTKREAAPGTGEGREGERAAAPGGAAGTRAMH